MLLRCNSAAAAGKPSLTAAARDTDTGRGCRAEGRQQYGGGVRPETPNLQYYIIYSLHVGCGLYFVTNYYYQEESILCPNALHLILCHKLSPIFFKSSAVFTGWKTIY